MDAGQCGSAYLREQHGCGCCIIGWDIEGPDEVMDTLPPEAVTAFAWPRDYCGNGSGGMLSPAKSALRRLFRMDP